jgi:hypothetical protein
MGRGAAAQGIPETESKGEGVDLTARRRLRSDHLSGVLAVDSKPRASTRVVFRIPQHSRGQSPKAS